MDSSEQSQQEMLKARYSNHLCSHCSNRLSLETINEFERKWCNEFPEGPVTPSLTSCRGYVWDRVPRLEVRIKIHKVTQEESDARYKDHVCESCADRWGEVPFDDFQEKWCLLYKDGPKNNVCKHFNVKPCVE